MFDVQWKDYHDWGCEHESIERNYHIPKSFECAFKEDRAVDQDQEQNHQKEAGRIFLEIRDLENKILEILIGQNCSEQEEFIGWMN